MLYCHDILRQMRTTLATQMCIPGQYPGAMAFRYRRPNGQPTKLTLGPYHPAIGLKDARQLASEAVVSVVRGQDPAAEKEARKATARAPKALDRTVGAVFREYFKHAQRNVRASSAVNIGSARALAAKTVANAAAASGWRLSHMGFNICP
jgi:Arm DNA-binding domain